ncbi:MAG: UTP--glucose-1-phosphate uridylyltransferase [Gemmataceae bacterium]
MVEVPPDSRQRLRQYGQEHVLTWWDQLNDQERRDLIEQLQGINLEQLRQLYAQRDQVFPVPPEEKIQPVPAVRLDPGNRSVRERGEEALRHGEVACLVVAGGQASRLGHAQPKGMFPIGPVTSKSLFQIHAEKVLALRRRYRTRVPLLVMTSPATHLETEPFFEQHHYFGLPAADVWFFCQGTMPALDLATGKLIMDTPGRLFTSPNGHGGTLTALADSGLLDRLRREGFRHLYYFQVDNPLVQMADPLFLGHHLLSEAEVSSKVIPKEGPTDKLGNLVMVDGRCCIIEYSDLPKDLAHATDATGQLRFRVGNPAIHIFAVDFLARVTQSDTALPYHLARKKVPYMSESGQRVQPEQENALKFERFIFDVLPLAERFTVVETTKRQEFAPLKNDKGPDSPETVPQAISDLAGDWLEQAGVAVPRDAAGHTTVPLEISPLFALDAGEFARKVKLTHPITEAMYWRE